jgi:hypothetical protein
MVRTLRLQGCQGDVQICRAVSIDCRGRSACATGEFKRIHNVILLLSPRRKHESDSSATGVCRTMADGGKSVCLYFDHPFWPRTREEFYQRRSTALERDRVPANDWGHPRGVTA